MTITRAAVTEAKSQDKRSRALANLTMTIAGGFTVGAGELFVNIPKIFDWSCKESRIRNSRIALLWSGWYIAIGFSLDN